MGQVPHGRIWLQQTHGPQGAVRCRQVSIQQYGQRSRVEKKRRRREAEKAQGREGKSRGQEEKRAGGQEMPGRDERVAPQPGPQRPQKDGDSIRWPSQKTRSLISCQRGSESAKASSEFPNSNWPNSSDEWSIWHHGRMVRLLRKKTWGQTCLKNLARFDQGRQIHSLSRSLWGWAVMNFFTSTWKSQLVRCWAFSTCRTKKP